MHPNCLQCKLDRQCLNARITGRGELENPRLVLIGECPAVNEDQQGEVFVGRTGELLTSLLGDKLPQVWITNAVRCCSYKDPFNKKLGSRNPTEYEVELCRPFLLKELRAFDPEKVILMPMGGIAYYGVFGNNPPEGITRAAGIEISADINGVKYRVIPNIHPAYIFRNPEMKSKFVGVLNRAFEGEAAKPYLESDWRTLQAEEGIKKLEWILEHKEEVDHVVLDLETTSFDPWNTEIIQVNFAHHLDFTAYSLPLKVTNHIHHPDYPYEVPIIEWEVTPEQLSRIKELVARVVKEIPLVGHNLKFDLKCLVLQGWIPDLVGVRIQDDTMILIHLIYNQSLGNLRLKDCSKNLFNIKDDWDRKITAYLEKFKAVKDRHFGNIPTGILGEYGALDAYYNRRLHDHLLENLPEKLKHLRSFMMPLVLIIAEAEMHGWYLDKEMYEFLFQKYGDMITEISKRIRSFEPVKKYIDAKLLVLGEKNERKRKKWSQEQMEEQALNIGSFKQLGDILYGPKFFGFPIINKSDGGSPSTDYDTLVALKREHLNEIQKDFINALLDFRTISKLKNTYVDPVMERVVEGKYKPDAIIPGTVTGRLASGFHTLPRGSDIKRMYTSQHRDIGGLVLSGDFSQLELRILAALAVEMKMVEAFLRGDDIHALTAAQIFQKAWNEVSKAERSIGKTTNFAIIYGKTAMTLKDDLGVTIQRAQEIIDNLLSGYDKVAIWMNERHKEVMAKGAVDTVFGRTIPIPERYIEKRHFQSEALRKAVNYPIQSTASDLAKSSLVRYYKKLKELKLRTMFLGEAHDALNNDLYPGEFFSVLSLLKSACEDENMEIYKDWLICPVRVDVSLGTSMGDLIGFEIKELREDSVLLEGSGVRRDWNQLMEVGSKGYQMKFYLDEETPIKPEDYLLEQIIRDTVKWEGKLEIRQK